MLFRVYNINAYWALIKLREKLSIHTLTPDAHVSEIHSKHLYASDPTS